MNCFVDVDEQVSSPRGVLPGDVMDTRGLTTPSMSSGLLSNLIPLLLSRHAHGQLTESRGSTIRKTLLLLLRSRHVSEDHSRPQ